MLTSSVVSSTVSCKQEVLLLLLLLLLVLLIKEQVGVLGAAVAAVEETETPVLVLGANAKASAPVEKAATPHKPANSTEDRLLYLNFIVYSFILFAFLGFGMG